MSQPLLSHRKWDSGANYGTKVVRATIRVMFSYAITWIMPCFCPCNLLFTSVNTVALLVCVADWNRMILKHTHWTWAFLLYDKFCICSHFFSLKWPELGSHYKSDTQTWDWTPVWSETWSQSSFMKLARDLSTSLRLSSGSWSISNFYATPTDLVQKDK